MIVASTKLKGILEASTKEEDIFSFQTNCLFEHVDNIEFSKGDEDESKNHEDIIQVSTRNLERQFEYLKHF
jgi:hypothetical protein